VPVVELGARQRDVAAFCIPCDDLGGICLGEGGEAQCQEALAFGVEPVTCPTCGAQVGVRVTRSPLEALQWTIMLMLPTVELRAQAPTRLVLPIPVDDLDALAHAYMAKAGIIGLSATFQLDRKETVVARGWGFASAVVPPGGSSLPARMRSDTPLRVGSLTKCLTGVAILRLVDKGSLSLDDFVLPLLCKRCGVNVTDVRDAQKKGSVTVRHLVHHISGSWLMPKGRSGFPELNIDLLRLLLKEGTLEGELPSRFQYSNISYVMLGRVIEAADDRGRSYEQFVQQEILQRCGVDGALGPRKDVEPAVGYYLSQERRKGKEFGLSVAPHLSCLDGMTQPDADGGWVLSTQDVVKFSRALDGALLLTPESRRELVTAHPMSNGYAVGWMVSRAGTRHQLGTLQGSVSVLTHTDQHGGATWALTATSTDAEPMISTAELEHFGSTCLPAVIELTKRGWD
jgi:CubicO group peptidase (beta-lactamase class C family)